MKDVKRNISYLRGYAEGLDLSPKSDEGKLIMKLIDVIESMADTIEELSDRVTEAEDMLDEIDECVLTIADDVYDHDYQGLEDFDDDYEDDFMDEYDDDYEEGGSDYFEIECPNCGEDVMIDFDMIDDDNEIVCPNCHEEIELEFKIGSDDEDKEE